MVGRAEGPAGTFDEAVRRGLGRSDSVRRAAESVVESGNDFRLASRRDFARLNFGGLIREFDTKQGIVFTFPDNIDFFWIARVQFSCR